MPAISSVWPMRPSGVEATMPAPLSARMPAGHLGLDHAGRDGVDRDALGPELLAPGVKVKVMTAAFEAA